MRLSVDYHGGPLEFDGDDDRLVAAWSGPPALSKAEALDRVRVSLEHPVDYPTIRQVVVPGDRVVVPFDPSLPAADLYLGAIAEILVESGVESITAVVDGRRPAPTGLRLPTGVTLVVHDPTDRESLAYLAATEAGRRVYLNRLLAEADVVVPVGRLGYAAGGGHLGPWAVIDPGLSDLPTVVPTSLLPTPDKGRPPVDDGAEVCWLLGCQFVVAGIPGRAGLLESIAGLSTSVRDRGIARLDEAWRLEVDDRADLVVAGIGDADRRPGVQEFVEGLRTAFRAVRRGGKIALLGGVEVGSIREALRGRRWLPPGDWEKAQAYADIYVAGADEPDELDDLGMIPLDRPEHAVKLANAAPSLTAISRAERTRVVVIEKTWIGIGP